VKYTANCLQLSAPQIRVIVTEPLRDQLTKEDTDRYSIGYVCEGNYTSAWNISNTYVSE